MADRNSLCVLGALLLVATVRDADAHHSFVGFYDQNDVIEIEGIVASTSWRNPHGTLTIDVESPGGETEQWTIETGSITVLRVRGLDGSVLKVGDQVRIAGERALRRDNGLYARNVLLSSGEEVLLSIGVEPRWTDSSGARLVDAVFDEETERAARETATGIFRVWAGNFDDPASFAMFRDNYPLNDAAKAVKAQWTPAGATEPGCSFKGMPYIMISPYPIEILDNGDEITMHFEEEDAVRTIHMNPDAVIPENFKSRFGFSRGRWEGTALVVETNNIDSLDFDDRGTPQSADARYIEYFSPSDNGSRLDYRLTVIDPATFTETFDLTKYMVWRPDLKINAYDCVVR